MKNASRFSRHLIVIAPFVLGLASAVHADNPLVPGVGMADPHLHIFNNKAYIYAGRDAYPDAKTFTMPDWNIWESEDLIHWKNVRTIYPSDTYMDPASIGCYASDAAYRNGYYYFYFSNHSAVEDDTGVLRATSPGGIYEDLLGRPLLPSDLTPTREYDPCCFIDDDPLQTPYIVFGWWDSRDTVRYFQIAKLNEDMMSLAEEPRPIMISGVEYNLDKPNLHKHGDLYYISMGSLYATSTNVYGPYTYRGQVGSTSGLGLRAHGNFREWNGQWYNVWCRYVIPGFRYRESLITYLHYKDNGEMVADEVLLQKHFDAGVGQYDAEWDQIEAEWYFKKSDGVSKKESPSGGFEVQDLSEGGFLVYPNVKNMPAKATMGFHVSSVSAGCIIEVRAGHENGALLGSCTAPDTGGWANYETITCTLSNDAGVQDLCLVFKGDRALSLHLDWFRISYISRVVMTDISASIVGSGTNYVNLTTEGPVDWAAWGVTSVVPTHSKTNGEAISDLTVTVIGSNISYLANSGVNNLYSWTDGSSTDQLTATDLNLADPRLTGLGGAPLTGTGSKISFTVQGSIMLQTVKIWGYARACGAQITATLRGSNVVTQVSPSTTEGAIWMYAISFKSDATNGVLNLTLEPYNSQGGVQERLGIGAVAVSEQAFTSRGTPFVWLDTHFPGMESPADYEAADASDSDGDGHAAWQEYLAGTNPTNANSVFAFTVVQPTNESFVLTWASVPTATYSVSTNINLASSPWSVVASGIAGKTGTTSYTTTPVNVSSFFKVDLE